MDIVSQLKESFYTDHDYWAEQFDLFREIYYWDIEPSDEAFRKAIIARYDWQQKNQKLSKDQEQSLIDMALRDLQHPDVQSNVLYVKNTKLFGEVFALRNLKG